MSYLRDTEDNERSSRLVNKVKENNEIPIKLEYLLLLPLLTQKHRGRNARKCQTSSSSSAGYCGAVFALPNGHQRLRFFDEIFNLNQHSTNGDLKHPD